MIKWSFSHTKEEKISTEEKKSSWKDDLQPCKGFSVGTRDDRVALYVNDATIIYFPPSSARYWAQQLIQAADLLEPQNKDGE